MVPRKISDQLDAIQRNVHRAPRLMHVLKIQNNCRHLKHYKQREVVT